MPLKICPASRPPPMASNAMVAPVAASASVSSAMKLSEVLSTTYVAPALLSSSFWSCERTMLTRPMPSFWQMRLSIWPRLEAAAVCTSALCPSRRMVSTMPSAVRGLTKDDAPSAGVVPSGSGRHCSTGTQRYCEYIAPPSAATVLPISFCAASDAPAATTTPAPSFPTGIDMSSLAAMAFMPFSGMRAVTTGPCSPWVTVAVLMSAAPNSRPMSEGLMGEASMRIRTSLSAGTGMGTLTSESSSSPVFLTRDRSWRAVFSIAGFMLDFLGRTLSDFYDAADLITGVKESFAALARGNADEPQNDTRLGRSCGPVVDFPACALVLAP